MKITVTAHHISVGIRCHATLGPVALALTDAGFENARVYLDYVEIDGSRISLPPEVSIIMSDLWYKRPVQPFSFEFNARLPLFGRLKAALSESISSLRRA